MKCLMLLGLGACVLFGGVAATFEDANAVVCARGVYRAGCAGPHGAVGVRRAPARYGAVRVRRY